MAFDIGMERKTGKAQQCIPLKYPASSNDAHDYPFEDDIDHGSDVDPDYLLLYLSLGIEYEP